MKLLRLFLVFNIINLFAVSEKPIKIIITSYKNAKWYKKNLDSVFNQNYTNYKIIYIDDASPDNTGNLVENYVKQKKQNARTTVIKNKEWLSQMANQYRAFHMCDDNDIIVTLDGDDWLHDNEVLSYVNKLYDDPNLWLTCCGAILWPSDEKCHCTSLTDKKVKKIISSNAFRSMNPFAHMRTFRAWLFKKIKLEDVLYKSTFKALAPTPDSAFMYPMLEMARNHFKRNSKICYVWNRRNPNSQARLNLIRQVELGRVIRQWKKYPALTNSDSNISKKFNTAKANVILLSEKPWEDLSKNLEILNQISNVDAVKIFVPETNSETSLDLSNTNLGVDLVYVNNSNFLPRFKDSITSNNTDHIILMTDNVSIDKKIDVNKCIKELERTFAYAFYLSLKNNNEIVEKGTYAPITNEIFAWQFEFNKKIWPKPNELGMILYRKNDIIAKLDHFKGNSINEFKDFWAKQVNNPREVGLFFEN